MRYLILKYVCDSNLVFNLNFYGLDDTASARSRKSIKCRYDSAGKNGNIFLKAIGLRPTFSRREEGKSAFPRATTGRRLWPPSENSAFREFITATNINRMIDPPIPGKHLRAHILCPSKFDFVIGDRGYCNISALQQDSGRACDTTKMVMYSKDWNSAAAHMCDALTGAPCPERSR